MMFEEINFNFSQLETLSEIIKDNLTNGNRFLVKCLIQQLNTKTYMLLEKIYNKRFDNFIVNELSIGEIENDVRIDNPNLDEAFEILKGIEM